MTATHADPTGGVAAPSTSADRRRAVLARLQGEDRARGTGNGARIRPRSTRSHLRLPSVRNQPGLWDTPATPAPIGYYVIAVVVAMFVMLGLVMVLSASSQVAGASSSPYEVFNRQALWAALGVVGLVMVLRVNLVWIRRFAVPVLLLTALAMLAPFAPGFGTSKGGARAWITFGNFSVQPSEFLKLAVVLFAADLLVRRQDDLSDVRRSLKPLLLLAGFAAGACLVQGDLGSAIVMTAIVLGVAFVGGVPLLPMIGTTILSAVTAVAFVFSSQYRYQRFTAFLHMEKLRSDESYQSYQALLAIADGGLTGSGVGAGNAKMGYLPLAHSDFIFAVVADELGFVGSIAVVGGFALLVWFGIQAALSSPDRFGMLLAGGISAWFGVQAIVNVGGVAGLMPVTGLTLPFFSAGGSSLFVSLVAAGLLLNVARRGGRPTE
jgi:cell division protein FtsW